jgi:AcrR family transcriptional regulator
MNTVMSGTSTRGSYHHGDLANALTKAAMDMARRGGPEAVVLRAAAREVGVSPTAAYRHFAGHDDLIHAVQQQAQIALADRMQAELDTSSPLPDPGAEALRRLRALGTGYLMFAFEQPGLFRTAFCRLEPTDEPVDVGLMSSPAFMMLTQTLDEMVECGLMAPSRRPFSEIATWSATHGLATLILDGPLAQLGDEERRVVMTALHDLLAAGLTAPAEPQ